MKVPFYPNTKDNTHCYQAVLMSILGYFLPEQKFSMKQLEKLTAKKKGKWTWPTQTLINLHEMGFDVKTKETFDYEKFVKNGGKYLIEKYGEAVGNTQIENSDMEQEIGLAKRYVSIFGNNPELPEIDELGKLLKQDYLLVINVNHYGLYGKKGYSGHFVVICDIDDKHVYLHDPGIPPQPNAKILIKNFKKAWEYPDKESRNYQAFRYKKSKV